MRRLLAVLAALLAGCAAAVAQPVTDGRRQPADLVACGPSAGSFIAPEGHEHARRPWMSREELVGYLTENAPRLSIKTGQQTAKVVPTAQFRLSRPGSVTPADWSRAWLEAVLYPAGTPRTAIPPESLVAGIVQPHSPTENETEVTVEFPEASPGWLPSRWEVVLLVCVDAGAGANPNLENNRLVREFGRVQLYVSSLRLSAALGVGAFALLYAVLAFTAARLHRRQFEVARAAAERESRRSIPAWQFALRPTVIAQDSFGFCSLARFQVLMFTLVLAGVYAYVMARTGSLPTLSNTVLALLGITLTGSTLARVIEGPVVDTPNRVWLLGTGVIDPSPRIPRWQDLLAGEGEIDVTRVQALAFSVFAALALVVNGTGDLEHFEIPEQLNYLIGLSQAVYVAGRALPRESAKRLNEEVRAAREAENQAIAKPGDQAALLAFETARNALGTSLFDFFGERFQAERLMQLRPGDRPAPVIY